VTFEEVMVKLWQQ